MSSIQIPTVFGSPQYLNRICLFLQVADDMLHQKVDIESCYIAAQTMRTKIQCSFHELPKESHHSLKVYSHNPSYGQMDFCLSNTQITFLCWSLPWKYLFTYAVVLKLVDLLNIPEPWGVFWVAVQDPVPFRTGDACCSQGRSLTSCLLGRVCLRNNTVL